MTQTISASEVRDKFAELLDRVDSGRIIVTKHGQEKAVFISIRELRALEETLAVLENTGLMSSIEKGLDDLRAGRTRPARDTFAELDAEFRAEE